jgi:putative peptidoglycan lipid II flippase
MEGDSMTAPLPGGASEPADVEARHRGLVARTVLVSALTLVSRLLGFLREGLTSAVFGDRSVISDAFFTAWRLPNLFRRLLGEGALSTALQADMTAIDAREGDAAGRALFQGVLRLTGVILLLVAAATMVLVAWMPDRLPLLGWQWLGDDPEPVRDLMVRLLPYVVLICLAAVCAGGLAVRGHFALPNLAPTVMNLVWIGALIWIGVASDWGRTAGDDPATLRAGQWELARWLAWGLLLGGVLQLALHLLPLRRFHLVGGQRVPSPVRPARVLWGTLPLVVGAAIYQINVMVDGLMANSLLVTGGASALYYANRIQQFPLALVSTAAVNAVFPALSAHAQSGSSGALRVRALHDRTQMGILFLALPSAAGLLALAEPIASVCLERGNFGAEGMTRVAVGLRFLAVALIPAGAAGVTTRAYVAMGDRRTPVMFSLVTLIGNVLLNVAFVRGLRMDVGGLTLSTALTSWLNVILLTGGLRTHLELPAGAPELPGRLVRMTLAAGLCGAGALGAHRGVAVLLGSPLPRHSLPALLAAIALGGGLYLAATRLLGVPESAELGRRLRRVLGRGRG